MKAGAGGDKRYDTIDAFRGIAILSVIAFHYFVRWAPPIHAPSLYGYNHIYSPLFVSGHLGVHLFFVISGLVITMTVLRSRDAAEFCVRRFARLYPAFIVGAVLTFVVTSFGAIPEFKTGLADFFASLTMDPSDLHLKPVDGSYWSLAVEVKFYAWVALSYFAFKDWFWLAIGGVAIAGALITLTGHHGIAERLFVASYMPLFLAGMAAWFLIFERQSSKGALVLALAAVLYWRFSPAYAQWGEGLLHVDEYLLPLIALMFAVLVLMPDIRLGPLAWIGRISYSLYLVQQFIGVIIIRELVRLGVPDIAAAAGATIFCVILAWLMFTLIEVPGKDKVMGAYHKIRQSGSAPAPEAAGAQS